MLRKVIHCAGHIWPIPGLVTSREMHWGDQEMRTAVFCTECSQMASRIQKVGRDFLITPVIFKTVVALVATENYILLLFLPQIKEFVISPRTEPAYAHGHVVQPA